MKYLLYSLRPKQWIKNFFVFLPLVFGGKLFSFPENLMTFSGFCVFSLTASAMYLINDILDYEKDREHPVKRLRPIPSGKVTVKQALFLAIPLGVFSITISFFLNISFGFVIITYVLFNLLYSKILKNAVIIDVFCIAFFFYLRIKAGSFLSNVELSPWILIMSALLALFLGFNKRRQEIVVLQ